MQATRVQNDNANNYKIFAQLRILCNYNYVMISDFSYINVSLPGNNTKSV